MPQISICLSVLQFAVNALQVKHIVLCGHYNCGGIRAALGKQNSDLVITNKWLMLIKNIYRLHQEEIDRSTTEEQRIDMLVDLNIVEQVHALAHTSIVQKAWNICNSPTIHGWVYSLSNGLLNPLITLRPFDTIYPIYEYEAAD